MNIQILKSRDIKTVICDYDTDIRDILNIVRSCVDEVNSETKIGYDFFRNRRMTIAEREIYMDKIRWEIHIASTMTGHLYNALTGKCNSKIEKSSISHDIGLASIILCIELCGLHIALDVHGDDAFDVFSQISA